MSKRVLFKAYQGDFDRGFCVILQIGDEDQPYHTEIVGNLPPAPEIHRYYQDWQSIYRRLGTSRRLESPPEELTHIGDVYQDCLNAANLLSNNLNNWLNSDEFRPVKEKLLQNLSESDEVRMILQVDDILMRLPWHLWDFFERYPKTEMALGRQNYAPLPQPIRAISKVRILAILGNSSNIDIKKDRELLQQLPNAEVHFLPEPKRSEISEQLWEKNWDILFFAGHSGTEGRTGKICINPTDSLSIDELKNGLIKAIQGGLQLAIFNSCDGLGLAQQLADLQISQVIVMREPIPDKVAQEFLKYFLGAFSKGESLYLSVRDARQRLEEELEKDYPCASWLPVIFQHPAGIPFAWRKQQKAGVQRSSSLGCMIFLILFCFILVFLPIIPEFINIVNVNSSVATQPEILNSYKDESDLKEAHSTAIGLISEFPFYSLFSSLPDISDKSPINGKFKLNYTSEGVVRQTTLKIQGNSGIMLTKFFNKETNKTEVVEQQAQLKKVSQGLVLKSSNPIYYDTRQPYPNYNSYNFIITINPNKTLKWKACNDEKKCSEVKVKQGFLTRIFGKIFD